MMRMNAMASRYPDEIYAAPRLSATPKSKPAKIAPGKLPKPPTITTANDLAVTMAPIVGKT
jgi:hypothetical protein